MCLYTVAQASSFAMASVRESVAALVADRRYGDIAAVCEKAEVEVRPSRGRCCGQLQCVVVVVCFWLTLRRRPT